MKFPDSHINTNQLHNMKIGQSGWIVPWGMWIDLQGNAYLNECYDYQDQPGGTVSLKITRIENGYIAWIYDMTREYKWESQKGPCYMSPREMCYGTVINFGKEEVVELKSPKDIKVKLLSFFNLN